MFVWAIYIILRVWGTTNDMPPWPSGEGRGTPCPR